MATYRINRTISKTWEIDENRAIWILGEKGRITGTDIHGIDADNTIGKATIVIDGDIELDGSSSAAYLEARRAVVTISDNGHLSATDGIFYRNDEGTTLIRNEGQFEGENGLYALTKQGGARIVNAGRIIADDVGIEADSAGATIANNRVIIAEDEGIRVDSQFGEDSPLTAEKATHVVNTGKVTGGSYSVVASDVAVNLRNRGTLNGDVLLYTGEDVVDNRGGTINGDVWLGSNNDTFDGRGGRLNGVLYGGGGDDRVTLASPATLYVENANEGIDRVWINATYRLGANIEVLALLGKASHTGIGNSLGNFLSGNRGDNALYGLDGDDTLYGAKGRDILTGGAGADVFCFLPNYGRDTIMDFEDGTDRIYFANFDGLTDFFDLDGKISQSGDDVVISFNDHDRLIIRDIALDQITEADFV